MIEVTWYTQIRLGEDIAVYACDTNQLIACGRVTRIDLSCCFLDDQVSGDRQRFLSAGLGICGPYDPGNPATYTTYRMTKHNELKELLEKHLENALQETTSPSSAGQ